MTLVEQETWYERLIYCCNNCNSSCIINVPQAGNFIALELFEWFKKQCL